MRSKSLNMDVKRSRGDGCERKNGAQRSFFVNVIARSDDRATMFFPKKIDRKDKEDIKAYAPMKLTEKTKKT
jgi:hypothetical protein